MVQDVAAFRTGVVNLTGGAFPEQLQSAQVSADYFRLFGAPVLRGRTFTAQEDLPQGEKVAILSENCWQRRFAGDPQILGKTISLGGDPHVVIGIIGAAFDFREFGPAPDIWLAFQLDPNTKDQGHYFSAGGRLKPGVTLQQAKARLQVSAADYRRKFPTALPANQGFSLEPVREALVKDVRSSLLVLVGAVSLVLLIACANVANLLLARAIGRRREMAIRVAMGAGRARIIRQLLTESVLLSLAGAVVGSAAGLIGIRALLSVNTANLPRIGEEGALVGLDWRVLVFTILVAVATGLIFGLIPALQTSRPDLSATLKESSGRSGTGFRQNKARTLLAVSEIALAVVLLVGAALLIRTFLALGGVNPGFNADNVLTMRMSLTGQRFAKSAGIERLVQDGVARVNALPGVTLASATCCVPLEGGYGLPFLVMGRPLTDGPFHGGGGWLTVSPGYFEVFKIPVLRGRRFYGARRRRRRPGGGDQSSDGKKVLAQRRSPHRQNLDRQGNHDGTGRRNAAADHRNRRRCARRRARQRSRADHVRSQRAGAGRAQCAQRAHHTVEMGGSHARQSLHAEFGNPGAIAPGERPARLRRAHDGRSRLPIHLAAALQHAPDDRIRRRGAVPRLARRLRFDGVLRAAAHAGDRHPHGAGRGSGHVLKMVVGQGMCLALVGVVIGIVSALGLSRLLATFLFGVKPRDLAVFIAVPLTLTLVSLIAVWLPARRAAHVDPATALRTE